MIDFPIHDSKLSGYELNLRKIIILKIISAEGETASVIFEGIVATFGVYGRKPP